jgi:hypothetical protein
VLSENWNEAIRILSGLNWISHPFLTFDDSGCPEVQLVICESERKCALRCVSLIRGQTGLSFYFDKAVSDWEAATRGFGSVRHGVLTTDDPHRDRGDA